MSQESRSTVRENANVTAQTRRGFFKRSAMLATGVAAVGAVGAAGCASLATNKHRKRGVKLGMVIDMRRCTGCKACAVACKAEFNVPIGTWRSSVTDVVSGVYPKTQKHFVPTLCNQCDNPPCIPVCPVTPNKATSAREKDGTVVVDERTCIGCGACAEACPYGARFVHPDTDIASKCDFCVERIDNGVVPSCVNTCPMNARVFGDLNDPGSAPAKLLAMTGAQVLQEAAGTAPAVFYIPPDATGKRIVLASKDRLNKDD